MNQGIKVEKTVTIGKSAEELYRFWHDFENLPRFMKHLLDVKIHNDKRSHWTTSGPLGTSVEWDADIVSRSQTFSQRAIANKLISIDKCYMLLNTLIKLIIA